MPVPSKAVQQDGNLRDASTYGYDAPSRFHKWALAGLLNPNVLELVHQTNPPKHEIMQIVSVTCHVFWRDMSRFAAWRLAQTQLAALKAALCSPVTRMLKS